MTSEQYERVKPYWLECEHFVKHAVSVSGTETMNELNRVNMELGNPPSCLTCSSGMADLLRMMYNHMVIYKKESGQN